MSLPIRSLLFVPANRPDRFGKALSSGADAVIIDLEDAVPPDDKTQARNAVAAWLSPQSKVYIRINGADTPWFRDDLALARMPGAHQKISWSFFGCLEHDSLMRHGVHTLAKEMQMNNRPIQVLLVDDYEILRAGVRLLISSAPHIEVSGEAQTAQEALKISRNQFFDVALLDINLLDKSGLQIIKPLR